MCFRNVPVVIEWKKSTREKSILQATYDAPVQLAAYMGAVNNDVSYDFKVYRFTWSSEPAWVAKHFCLAWNFEFAQTVNTSLSARSLRNKLFVYVSILFGNKYAFLWLSIICTFSIWVLLIRLVCIGITILDELLFYWISSTLLLTYFNDIGIHTFITYIVRH